MHSALALTLLISAASPSAQDAAEAAASAVPMQVTRAAMMLQLARALADAGKPDAARLEAVKVTSLLMDADDTPTLPFRSGALSLLVRLGKTDDAFAIVQRVSASAMRMQLLGALGADFARRQDGPHLDRIVAAIKAAPDATPGDADSGGTKDDALTPIGMALAASNRPGEARALAGTLKDEAARLRVLTEAALAACAHGPTSEGAAITAQVASLAAKQTPRFTPSVRGGRAAAAAAAAACRDVPSAQSRLDEAPNPGLAREHAVALLDAAGLTGPADGLAPRPDPGAPAELLEAAERRLRLEDRTASLGLARQAAGLLPIAPRGRQDTPDTRRALAVLLITLRADDAALAVIQGLPAPTRVPLYLNALHDQAADRDRTGLRKTLAAALGAIHGGEPSPAWVDEQLGDVALVLARAGDFDDARHVFATMAKPQGDAGNSGRLGPYAVVQALLGDIPGALKTASLASHAVTQDVGPGNDGQGAEPDPQAAILSSMVGALADADRLADVPQIEARLDAGGPALQEPRDHALAAIAEAQRRAGNSAACLATALRIDDPAIRFPPLLKLVGSAGK